MTLTAPFYLHGAAGKSLGLEGYSFEQLGITDAVLKLRSLDVDELTFTLRDNGRRPVIPDDGQWLTLKDDAGQTLFTGIAKRSFQYPEKFYGFTVQNVYKGMMETPLLGANGRPYISYYSDQIVNILTDILARATEAGFPIQAPATMPAMYAVPKMTFRGTTLAAALEDTLKWAPDMVTRMDYSTNPPTLRFFTRTAAAETTIDLASDTHKTTMLQLTAIPEARAAGLSFSYAIRNGETSATLATQQAGDPNAAGAARQSVYLTGADRLDAFLAEAFVAALYAKAEVDKLIIAGGGTVNDNNPALTLSWETCLALDTGGGLAGAVAAESGFIMNPATGSSFSTGDYWTSYSWGNTYYEPYNNSNNISTTPLYLADANSVALNGWYAVEAGFFTALELAEVGVQLQAAKILGNLVRYNTTAAWTAGETYLRDTDGAVADARRIAVKNDGRIWIKYAVNCPVDAINVAPSVAISLLSSNNDGFNAKLVTRADYADIPGDLAQNYFTRQDWTPYKGTISFTPTVLDIPEPGDYLSVIGVGTPADWGSMKVPVAETSIVLATRAVTCTLGPSPRQDFQSLVDRLRIPQEDNYQAG